MATCAYCGAKSAIGAKVWRGDGQATCCQGRAEYPVDKRARPVGGQKLARIVKGRGKHARAGRETCQHERTFTTLGGAQVCAACGRRATEGTA